MSNFRDQMEQDMQLRGFSPRTQYKYLAHLRQFEEFFQKNEEIGQGKIRNFLYYLISETLPSVTRHLTPYNKGCQDGSLFQTNYLMRYFHYSQVNFKYKTYPGFNPLHISIQLFHLQ
jgi:hypothetical protein